MRIPLLLAVAAASIGCHDTTRPPDRIQYYMSAFTQAYLMTASTDSIACHVNAYWDSAEPITIPWSGTVQVRAWRSRTRDWPMVSLSPTQEGSAQLSISRIAGDSVQATLQGAVNLTFGGRNQAPDVRSGGQWICDSHATLGSSATGEARGSWSLMREYPID